MLRVLRVLARSFGKAMAKRALPARSHGEPPAGMRVPWGEDRGRMVDMMTRIYVVEGMTCDHCVAAVTTEVAKVLGISDVIVNLEEGTLTVTGDASEDALAEAVDEAGYALVVCRSGSEAEYQGADDVHH